MGICPSRGHHSSGLIRLDPLETSRWNVTLPNLRWPPGPGDPGQPFLQSPLAHSLCTCRLGSMWLGGPCLEKLVSPFLQLQTW